jgi:site-specific DNA recombinase
MQGMMAADERRQMTERTRRGRVHKARQAACMPWAYRMYGYRETPKQAGRPPRVESHPAQADVVRAICGWLLHAQLPTRQIVKRFNAQHIPPRTGQHPVGPAASVRSLLSPGLDTGHGSDHKTKTGLTRQETRRTCSARQAHYARAGRPPEEWGPITAPAIMSAPICAQAQEPLQRQHAQARRASQPASPRSLGRTRVRCGHCQ